MRNYESGFNDALKLAADAAEHWNANASRGDASGLPRSVTAMILAISVPYPDIEPPTGPYERIVDQLSDRALWQAIFAMQRSVEEMGFSHLETEMVEGMDSWEQMQTELRDLFRKWIETPATGSPP